MDLYGRLWYTSLWIITKFNITIGSGNITIKCNKPMMTKYEVPILLVLLRQHLTKLPVSPPHLKPHFIFWVLHWPPKIWQENVNLII